MVHVFVPYSFLGFDTAIYFVSAIIGLMVAFFAYKTHELTSKRTHFFLYAGFVSLSMGFLILSLVSAYDVLTLKVLCESSSECYSQFFDLSFDVRDFGYWIYFIASFIAYAFFMLMYLPENIKLPMFSILPLWFVFFPFFHLFSFFMISLVIFRSIIGYASNKTTNSLLTMLAFLFIGMFHVLLFLTSFSKVIYVAAHFILLAGFIMLLSVLLRINKKKPTLTIRLGG